MTPPEAGILAAASWPAWGAVALLGAWLSLDETSLAQTWFSQPLPSAVITGLALGDPVAGLLIGLPFQLATVGELPVGHSFLGDKPAAVVGVTAASAGVVRGVTIPWHLEPEVAATVGWLLVLTAIASMLGNFIIRRERRLHLRWSAAGLRSLGDGHTSRLDRVQGRCLLLTAGRGAAVALIWALVAQRLWLPALASLPDSLIRGLALLPTLTVGVAVGALVELYGSRRGLRWLLAGFAATMTAWWFVGRGGGA